MYWELSLWNVNGLLRGWGLGHGGGKNLPIPLGMGAECKERTQGSSSPEPGMRYGLGQSGWGEIEDMKHLYLPS